MRVLAREKPAVVLDALRSLPLLEMPRRHAVLIADVNPQYLDKILLKTYERAPEDFETLLGMEGVGAETLRALALASEVIYGTLASTRDPARFSFAVGGKDGFPYPVDLETYDKTVEVLRAAVNKANIDRSERVKALKRLVDYGKERIAARGTSRTNRPGRLYRRLCRPRVRGARPRPARGETRRAPWAALRPARGAATPALRGHARSRLFRDRARAAAPSR